MKLHKRIQLNNSPYVFELTLDSKNIESHSLMTDNKEQLLDILGNLTNLIFTLREMADQHQQKLKGYVKNNV